MTRMSEPLDLTAWMTRWQMFPPPEGLILCAVSGGRDSVCLLDCLWKLGRARDFRVAAAHLNHGMRPTAQRDEDLVRALCAERNIPFYTETVDVYALCAVWRLTVEETGRRARYDFLRRTADALAADFIATAHHRDDQAETVLLQLLRGTGPQGLTGIPPVRDGIIRPLLDTPRAAIDDYIAQNRLPYVTDETNLDTHYARNRLRLDIMPRLRAINPAAVTHITRTADILRAENDLLDAQAAALLPPEGTTLPCAALLSAPEALRPRMLRLLTDRLGAGKKDFTAAHYRALTDGPASNNCLDMFREMFLTTSLAKLKEKDASAVDANEVLKMATLGGARAMGLRNCDTLSRGKLADLIVIDLNQPNMQPINNITKNLVYSGSKQNVVLTMVNGNILYEKGEFNIGEEPEEIYETANKMLAKIK